MITATLDTIDALEALAGPSVRIDYMGEVQSEWDESAPSTVDQWRVTLYSKAGLWSTDYYTGLLHRKRTYSELGRKWDAKRKKRYDDKPKRPKVADVMYSLTLDASAADENFHDWCANYGYSDDSIKAMKTYNACLDIAQALRKHFSPDTLRQVRELLQDY